MLTEAQRKLVRKFYLLPQLARRALTTIFILSAEMLLLSMLDDLVFQTPGAFLPGWIAYIALVIVLTVFCCYAYLSPRLGMGKPRWEAIECERRAARAQAREQAKAAEPTDAARMAAAAAAEVAALGQAAGDPADAASAAYGISGTARYLEATNSLARDAERAARDLGIGLPDAKRAGRIMMLATLLALALVYGAHFIARTASMRADSQVAAETISAITDAFERRGYYVIGDDPAEAYDRDGYSVNAHLSDTADDTTFVSLDVDNDGVVTEVSYKLQVDPARSLEENLARAEERLAELHAVVEGLDVPVAAPGLLSYGALPDAFSKAFRAGTLYDDIYLSPDDLGSSEGAAIWCSFDTLPKEDWFDGMEPDIWLTLETDR